MKNTTTLALLVSAVLSPGAHAQMANDPSYQRASFNEVLSVLENQNFVPKDDRAKREFQSYGPQGISGGVKMPHFRVDYLSLGGLFLSPAKARSKQTLVDRADYYDYFKKLVHANGVCVTGKWQAFADSPYSGLFQKGASGLFIGRISTALNETQRVDENGKELSRGFGLAGKLFPTLDSNAKVPTTSFFTVDVLSGTKAPSFLGVNLTNDPPLIPSFDLLGELAKIVPAFLSADSSPTFRPVTQIAEAGPGGAQLDPEAVAAPIWMRLRAAQGTVVNDENDFRREVIRAIQENGESLRFTIEASKVTGDRNAESGWDPIGAITLNRAILSFGCDRRLHFSHPKDDHSKPKGAK